MRLDALTHLTRSVLAMSEVDRLVVFGSASLLAHHPELGDTEGSPLLTTYDADLIPFPFEEQIGIMLDEAFGEDRTFHERFGYHADIVRPKVTETFPTGWGERTKPLDGVPGAECLEPHDMAAAKSLIGRDKDQRQLAYLLEAGILSLPVLTERVGQIAMPAPLLEKAGQFLEALR